MAAEDGVPPVPELIQLGATLGNARRQRGLSLEELASRLRLGTEQLMALEAGDRTHLPEPVFVVAQAKRVAGALGIDISQQISDLLASRMMREPQRPARAPLPRRPQPGAGAAQPSRPWNAPRSEATGSSPGRWPWLLLAAGGLVVAVAVLQGRSTTPPPWSAGTPATSPAVPAPATPVPASTRASEAPGTDQLRLRSEGPSWLEVRSSKGAVLFRGTLVGEQTFPLGDGLMVLAGRPDLVMASSGRQQPLPLGRIDQVVWKRFTPGAVAR